MVKVHGKQFQTLNDFQKSVGDINWRMSTIGLSTYELSNLFQTLHTRRLTKGTEQKGPVANSFFVFFFVFVFVCFF